MASLLSFFFFFRSRWLLELFFSINWNQLNHSFPMMRKYNFAEWINLNSIVIENECVGCSPTQLKQGWEINVFHFRVSDHGQDVWQSKVLNEEVWNLREWVRWLQAHITRVRDQTFTELQSIALICFALSYFYPQHFHVLYWTINTFVLPCKLFTHFHASTNFVCVLYWSSFSLSSFITNFLVIDQDQWQDSK